jgi:hypothetical protein
MSAATMTDFSVRALPTGEPDASAATCREVVAEGGEPCRRCLHDALPGERLHLLSYDPFPVRSPYAGAGPVFVHADGCVPYEADAVVPTQLRRRLLAVRAYDADGMMVDNDVVDGQQLEALAERLLADPRVAFANVHYARPGCFACQLLRV